MTITTEPPAVRRTDRPLERLEAEIVELASQITAASARLIVMIGEFDAAQGWREWGMRSTAHWLSWKCGIGLGAGREQVRVARALRGLPGVAAAFAAGRLSYSKVRALTRFATPDTETELVVTAEHATGAQIERLAAQSRRALTGEEVRVQRAGEFVRFSYADDGSLIGSFRIAPDRAAVFRHAVDAAAGRVPDPTAEEQAALAPEPGDPRDEAERRQVRSHVDGLIAMAELTLQNASAETSTEGAERFQLVLHSTVEQLAVPDTADDTGPAGTELFALGRGSVRVHPATARRLTCDCPTSTMVDGPDGAALHLGRRTRRIAGRLRRAVHARDRGLCRAPGCTARATQIHHLRHWANGGPTCHPNLVSLCDSHHWLVHEGGFTLATRGGGSWVLLGPTGVTVGPHPTPHLPTQPLPADPSVAPAAVTGQWAGDRLDADLVIRRVVAATTEADDVSAETPSPPPASRQSPANDTAPFTQADIDRWLAGVEAMDSKALRDGVAFIIDDE